MQIRHRQKRIEACHRPSVNREGVAEQVRLLLAVVGADQATKMFEAHAERPKKQPGGPPKKRGGENRPRGAPPPTRKGAGPGRERKTEGKNTKTPPPAQSALQNWPPAP